MADKNKNKEVNKKEEVSEAVSEEVSEAVSEAAPDYLESDGFTLVDLDDYDYSEEDEYTEEYVGGDSDEILTDDYTDEDFE